MKIAILGASSLLSKCIMNEFCDDNITTFGRKDTDISFDAEDISLESIERIFVDDYDTYIFNLGYLQSKRIVEQTSSEIFSSLCINALFTIKSCEYLLSKSNSARIFIIGSESGKKGSFDTSYFLAKSMLRAYVKERKLLNEYQQLLLISPSTIEDGKMTLSREDVDTLNFYRKAHPKKRFLRSAEVSRFICDLIKNESTYLCNTEIELNGGKFSRMSY